MPRAFGHAGIALIVLFVRAVSGQTAPATAPTTKPDLSTPQKAAIAFYQSMLDEDGAAYLASIDTRDDSVRAIVTGFAAEKTALGHVRAAAKAKLGGVPADFPPVVSMGSDDLTRMIIKGISDATPTVKDDHATLTPVLPHGPGEGDMGTMFRMELMKVEGAWRVRLQDSEMVFKMSVDPGGRMQAEIAGEAAPDTEALATAINAGTIKSQDEVAKQYYAILDAAQDRVMAKYKAGRGTPAPATQPRN